ncbi:CRISPR-associated protein, Cse2 family [Nitrosospira sp. Nsp14]|uniref:type I-E CRISPR-associated protein Cse2/CasB n=1 Tax=Nitrosospira sp. Nsp14 TaxID=1855333 RepID=UPI0008F3E42F|nr:type I-E CRISPR-associated protein Cse2/CasB [Nitrosospira sp. Nsp14]SFH44820.1 CRISPR-associated protein, Cse2 family [Nitrosospira sp. Nsp14]
MSTDTQDALQKTGSSRSRSLAFVDYIINRCQADNGIRAALKRADNPATEYQSWEMLAGFRINLEYENQRLPHATVAAAIARAKIEKNGTANIGQAIAHCYEDGNASDQAKAKLRRLLACDSVPETCRILRPLLGLIESRGDIVPDYATLLNDLLRFGYDDSRAHIKARWAQNFYGKQGNGEKDE